MPSGLLYLNPLKKKVHCLNKGCLFLLISCFVEISELNVNSVDPDQTPRLIWVNSVWQSPFHETLGLNGLIENRYSFCVIHPTVDIMYSMHFTCMYITSKHGIEQRPAYTIHQPCFQHILYVVTSCIHQKYTDT